MMRKLSKKENKGLKEVIMKRTSQDYVVREGLSRD